MTRILFLSPSWVEMFSIQVLINTFIKLLIYTLYTVAGSIKARFNG